MIFVEQIAVHIKTLAIIMKLLHTRQHFCGILATSSEVTQTRLRSCVTVKLSIPTILNVSLLEGVVINAPKRRHHSLMFTWKTWRRTTNKDTTLSKCD